MKVLLGYEIGTGADVEIPLGHLVVSGQTQLSGKTTTLEAIVHRSKLRAVAFVTKRGEGVFTSRAPQEAAAPSRLATGDPAGAIRSPIAGAHEIPPFYRSPKSGVMWQYVSEVLQSKLGEKMKFERKWIMRVSKGAFSLWDVHENVKAQLTKPKLSEWDRGIFEQLDAYFELVLPELELIAGNARTAKSQAALNAPLYLRDGINVMRLEKFSTETQMLCVASVLEHVYREEEGVITIIPEAWEMVPQGRNTPVKAAAATMFRKGAALRNFVWFDSQDLAGVDKQALKQVSVWILGVQREENEAKRMIEHLDVGGPKPKLGDVRTLGIGEFFASYGKQLKKVYVLPQGVPGSLGQEHAKGKESVDAIKAWMERQAKALAIEKAAAEPAAVAAGDSLSRAPIVETGTGVSPGDPVRFDDAPPIARMRAAATSPTKEEDEEAMENQRIRELEKTVESLSVLVKHYEELLQKHKVPGFTPRPGTQTAKLKRPAAETAAASQPRAAVPQVPPEYLMPGEARESLYQDFKARLLEEEPAGIIRLIHYQPEIDLKVERKTYQLDDSTLKGKLALMITKGFFDQGATGNAAFNDLKARGVATAKPNVYRELDSLTSMGFLLKSDEGYRAIPGMKREIKAAHA